MPVGLVILAFIAGGFHGSIAMALAYAAQRPREVLRVERDDGLGVPLPMGDTVKRHRPDLTRSSLRAT
jgi:hypothetical protein